jgi:hypothetical protein
MLLGYVQKTGFFGHVFAICSFCEHMWMNQPHLIGNQPTRARQLCKRFIRRDRLSKNRLDFKLGLWRQQRKIVLWLIRVKPH